MRLETSFPSLKAPHPETANSGGREVMSMRQVGVREKGAMGTVVKWTEGLLLSSTHGDTAGMQPSVATSPGLSRKVE